MENQNSSIFNFSKSIGLVLALFFILGGGLSYLFEQEIIFSSEVSGASKVNRILNQTFKEEIPIFGSSRADGSYVPSLIDSNSFNYGIAGTHTMVWLFFLEQELAKNKSSDIIINFDLSGLAYSIGDVSNYIPNYPRTRELMLGDEKYQYRIPLLKYFGGFEKYFKDYLNEKYAVTKHVDNGGKFEKNILTTKKMNELIEIRKKTAAKFELDDEIVSKIDALVSSTNRHIFFVVAPYHSSFFEKFENLNEAKNFLQRLGMYKNVTVLDLSDFVQEDSLFMNTTHLNYAGAQKFSIELNRLFLTNKKGGSKQEIN